MVRIPLAFGAILASTVLLAGCGPGASSKTAESQGRTTQDPGTANFIVVEDERRLSNGWSIRLPGKFRQRLEDDTLIFWRKGLTVHVLVWKNDAMESEAQRLSWIKKQTSPEGFEVQELQDGKLLRYAYRLTEKRNEGTVHALYGYAIGQTGYVQMAVYFDREPELDTARSIWRGITEHLDGRTQ